MKTVEERFWSKVEKTNDCWNWTAAKTTNGYGAFSITGRLVYAHRTSWELAGNKAASGMVVDHTCWNRACVNPQHLREATTKQNCENRSLESAYGSTGLRGVYWCSKTKKYRGRVTHAGKGYCTPYFQTVAEAHAAVVELRNSLFTHNDADRRAA